MPLKVGDTAPPFSLVDTQRQKRTLGEFVKDKTIIAFYPATFTGVCTKGICSFRDSLEELGASVVAISVDSPFSNRVFAEQNRVKFPVLSDFTRHVSAQYAGLYKDLGGVQGYTAAKRSVFVLTSHAIVRYAWISDNPAAEPNYEELKQALSSF